MKNPIKSKIHPLSSPLTDDSKTPHDQAMRTLTNEEILAVAGGPEVDVSAGGGGG